jgi:hypothetical protein
MKYSIYDTGESVNVITKNNRICMLSISSNGLSVKQIPESCVKEIENNFDVPVCTGYLLDTKESGFKILEKIRELSYAGVFEL